MCYLENLKPAKASLFILVAQWLINWTSDQKVVNSNLQNAVNEKDNKHMVLYVQEHGDIHSIFHKRLKMWPLLIHSYLNQKIKNCPNQMCVHTLLTKMADED